MSTIITRQELRDHYKAIQGMITEERRLRETVLANSPKLTEKLKKCDDALASLYVLGNALAALLPADDVVAIQAEMFPAPTPASRWK